MEGDPFVYTPPTPEEQARALRHSLTYNMATRLAAGEPIEKIIEDAKRIVTFIETGE